MKIAKAREIIAACSRHHFDRPTPEDDELLRGCSLRDLIDASVKAAGDPQLPRCDDVLLAGIYILYNRAPGRLHEVQSIANAEGRSVVCLYVP